MTDDDTTEWSDGVDAPVLEELPDDVAAEIGHGALERATTLYEDSDAPGTDELAHDLKDLGHRIKAARHPDAERRRFHAGYLDDQDVEHPAAADGDGDAEK